MTSNLTPELMIKYANEKKMQTYNLKHEQTKNIAICRPSGRELPHPQPITVHCASFEPHRPQPTYPSS